MKPPKKLTELRREIDDVDRELANLLLKRFELTDQVLQEKMEFDLPIQDTQREKEILEGLNGDLSSGAYLKELLMVFHFILKVSCESMKKKNQRKLR